MDAVKLHRHTGGRREAVSTLAAAAAGRGEDKVVKVLGCIGGVMVAAAAAYRFNKGMIYM